MRIEKMMQLSWGRGFRCLMFVAIVCIALGMVFPSQPQVSQAQNDGQLRHVVQAGENLFRIALRYGVTLDELAAANNITDPTRIYAGQVLIIPVHNSAAVISAQPVDTNQPAPVEPVQVAQASETTSPLYHIVQTGQNLTRIAEQYNVTMTDLITWNAITNPNNILVGQKLVVGSVVGANGAAVAGPTVSQATPVESTPAVSVSSATERTHVVQAGERLASIARLYGVDWPTIARANNISNPNQIYAGQALVIPAQSDGQGTYFTLTGGAPSAPAPTITTGKQIIVDLGDQQVFAYENGQLLKRVIVSTGLPGTPTVLGNYRVYWKLSSQTMSGPGYYLPGVPWVMYFYQGYAIHGTYWHNNFGYPMSHGCVNLPTLDAQWFFNWAEVGTPVLVQS